MSDAFEDGLRSHFAEKAAHVQVSPNPGALMELSASRSRRRRPLMFGALLLVATLVGSGVLAGAQLVGGRSTPTPLATAPSTTTPGRAGASLAPNAAGGPNLPSSAGPTPFTLLFTRTTSSGVAIRSYLTDEDITGSCEQSAPCAPVTSPPGSTACPQGAMCVEPSVTPQTQSGTTRSGSAGAGGTASSGSAGGTAETLPPNSSESTTTSTVLSQPVAGCDQLVVELSTSNAVGSDSVSRPSAAPSPDAVEILGVGSFGTQEGAPVGWVAVIVGSGVASVNLSSGGTLVDTMTPISGIVVLVMTGNADLTGVSVVGIDQSGATVATVPVAQASGVEGPIACTTSPIVSPSTLPPTTTPPLPPSTNTSTTSQTLPPHT
jgi:hypothetical protein